MKRALILLLLTSLFAVVRPANAAERRFAIVVRAWPGRLIGLTRNAEIPWQVTDYFCAAEVRSKPDASKKYVACGQVVRITRRGIIISLSGVRRPIRVGDKFEVERVDAKQFYDIGLVAERFADPVPHHDRRILAAGMEFPMFTVRFEQGVMPHYSIGLSMLLVNSTSPLGQTISGFGSYLTGNWYPGRLYRGLWLSGGIGMFFANASDPGLGDSRKAVPSLMATVGYKALVADRLVLGIAAGGRLLINPNPTRFDAGIAPFYPIIMGEVGFRF